jgi:ketosteroid isomerase-like protein
MTSTAVGTTNEVLDRHLQCFGSCDLAGIIADYAPDAVVFMQHATFRGSEEIAGHFKMAFAEFSKPGVSFTMIKKDIDGDFAFIVWSAETADNIYEMGTDTFVVRGGRIVAQTFAAKVTPKH